MRIAGNEGLLPDEPPTTFTPATTAPAPATAAPAQAGLVAQPAAARAGFLPSGSIFL